MKLKILIILIILSVVAVESKDLRITEISEDIMVDGVIDEIWTKCNKTSLDFQLEPNVGDFPSRKTFVSVAQNQNMIYFLFICHINSKKEISTSIQQRDQLNTKDDMVSLMLDTYNDNRTAILFQVNPLGTITDAKLLNDGKSKDYLWDTEWTAQTSVTSEYWTAEIAIPLSSIPYNPNLTTWGLNLSRSIRKNQEIVWWGTVSENYRVSQGGKLTNLNLSQENKHRLSLFPYATGRYEDSDISGKYNDFSGDAGVDIKYNYSSNINANLTVNPDFATIEGDKEQINLTPWELKFPEKRIFFQDGNEMFDTRIQTFYSRRIGDILFGGKVNGKVGKYQFNGLFANTKENKDLDISANKYTAFRVKRDFLNSSALGATYTNKFTDSTNYHSFSGDYILNLDNWKLTGQLVSTLPGDFASHSAWFTRFARENNTYHYHIRYTELGENFKENLNQTGYISDQDRREVDGDVMYKFWFDKHIQYLRLSGRNNIFWSRSSGELRSWYLTYTARTYFQNKISLDIYYNDEYKNSFRGKYADFYNHFYMATIGYNTDENQYAKLSYRQGVNFKRDFELAEFESSIRFFENFSLDYELKYLYFSPDETDESTWLNIVGMSYYQTNDLWARIFAQHSTKNNHLYLYGQLGWRFKPPFGAIYLIYSSDEYKEILTDNEIQSDIFFLKITYPLHILK